MSEKLSFDFYSVLKNEDAPPFIGKDFLVVADGLGGSGSTVHEIDFEQHPDLGKELMEAAFGDFDEEIAEQIAEYLNVLLEPMADRSPDTSALWASRIAIGRFVYAMLEKKIPVGGSNTEIEKKEAQEEQVSDCETRESCEDNHEKTQEEQTEQTPDCGACEACEDGCKEDNQCCNEENTVIPESDKLAKKETIKIDISSESDRAALSDFINLGLERVANKLSLNCGGYSGQRLLPTTLAALCFEEGESTVNVDCVWAGDSRCYVLTPSGLSLLSVDDEDSSGSITNLFYVGTKKAVLHCRHYEIEKPCALMAVSDGIFDPVDSEDYWGVEYFFQGAILESASFDELSANLKKIFDSIRGDDSTVAFRAFGFDDYADMKQKLEPRAKYIEEKAQQWQNSRNAIELMNVPESDVSSYVTSRTSDKYQSIAPILVRLILEGKDDAAIGSEIKAQISAVRHEREASVKKAQEEAQADVLNAIYSHLCADPDAVKNAFLAKKLSKIPEVSANYQKLLKQASELKKCTDYMEKDSQKLAQLNAEYEYLANELSKKVEDYHKVVIELARAAEKPEKRRDWIEAMKQEFLWEILEYSFMHNIKYNKWQDVYSNNGIMQMPLHKKQKSLRADPVANKVFEFWDKEGKFRSRAKNSQHIYEQQKQKFESLLKAVFDALATTENPLGFFKEDFVNKVGLEENSPADIADNLPEFVEQMFASQKDERVAEIVKALAENYDKTSAIDVMYNATRLARFREYYKYKNSPMDEVLSLSKDLEAIKLVYYSMINSDAT